MSWNTILGVACTISLFLPVVALIYYRLYKHRSLAALGLSYLFTAIYNLMSQGILPAGVLFQRVFGVVNNYLDVPLILTGLLFFCSGKQKQKSVQFFTLGFIVYEIIIAIIFDFKAKSIVYIMGPGLILVLAYTFYFFSGQVKITVMHGKNIGKTIMLASILFAYGCYGLVYFFYYILETSNVADTFLIYFITSTVSCTMMTIGIHMISKRMKKLDEARNTRRELAMFFGHS